jgi:gamma-butyrobetaine dioxygenase
LRFSNDLDAELHPSRAHVSQNRHYENPPRYQFLHCLHKHPTLKGGKWYFVDSFRAAELLERTDPSAYRTLTTLPVAFEYRNGGHWRRWERPTIELCRDDQYERDRGTIHAVNYSPPFQAPQLLHSIGPRGFTELHRSLAAFADLLARPDLTFTINPEPGQCVAFDNRRVLHARTAFSWEGNHAESEPDTDDMPARWLKGMYVEGDSVRDHYRVLRDQLARARYEPSNLKVCGGR